MEKPPVNKISPSHPSLQRASIVALLASVGTLAASNAHGKSHKNEAKTKPVIEFHLDLEVSKNRFDPSAISTIEIPGDEAEWFLTGKCLELYRFRKKWLKHVGEDPCHTLVNSINNQRQRIYQEVMWSCNQYPEIPGFKSYYKNRKAMKTRDKKRPLHKKNRVRANK
jgi:hypothetical protein